MNQFTPRKQLWKWSWGCNCLCKSKGELTPSAGTGCLFLWSLSVLFYFSETNWMVWRPPVWPASPYLRQSWFIFSPLLPRPAVFRLSSSRCTAVWMSVLCVIATDRCLVFLKHLWRGQRVTHNQDRPERWDGSLSDTRQQQQNSVHSSNVSCHVIVVSICYLLSHQVVFFSL